MRHRSIKIHANSFFDVHAKRNRKTKTEKTKKREAKRRQRFKRKLRTLPFSILTHVCTWSDDSQLWNCTIHTTIKIQRAVFMVRFNFSIRLFALPLLFLLASWCACVVCFKYSDSKFAVNFMVNFIHWSWRCVRGRERERERERDSIDWNAHHTKLTHYKVARHHPLHIDGIRENFDTANVIQLQCEPI